MYQLRGRRIQLPVAKGKASPWRWLPVVINVTHEAAQRALRVEDAPGEAYVPQA